MNFLVFLDPNAGELEKVLSGLKTMVVKAICPTQSLAQPVSPGDNLYFLRENDAGILRVMARVVRVYCYENHTRQGLSHTLKEMQPKLQFTEEQYNHWSAEKQVMLVEFAAAQKIGVFHVTSQILSDHAKWIPFEEISHVTH